MLGPGQRDQGPSTGCSLDRLIEPNHHASLVVPLASRWPWPA
jgi:hypothetical protein